MNPEDQQREAVFGGITCWADVFARKRQLTQQGARMELYPLIVAAILCDAGGGIEVGDRAVREACERGLNGSGENFNMRLVVDGIEIEFPDSAMAGVAIDAKAADSQATPVVALSEILANWKMEMQSFCADRRRIGDRLRAEGAEVAMEKLEARLKEAAGI